MDGKGLRQSGAQVVSGFVRPVYDLVAFRDGLCVKASFGTGGNPQPDVWLKASQASKKTAPFATPGSSLTMTQALAFWNATGKTNGGNAHRSIKHHHQIPFEKEFGLELACRRIVDMFFQSV